MKLRFLIETKSYLMVSTILILAACGSSSDKNEAKQKESTHPSSLSEAVVAPKLTTYQHIALANIKDDMWEEYIAAMHNNIANSRKESGNIIFTLFQPEDGMHQVAFMERFQDTIAFNQHLKADYLPEVVTQKSLIGEMEIQVLKELNEIPAIEPENADEVLTPRNVIVFFEVKPEHRSTFIKAIAEVTPHARAAEGNVRFNIFQLTDDENKFVLLESWESIANHEGHLAQDYSKQFDIAVDGVFVTNPMESRMLTKDISMKE